MYVLKLTEFSSITVPGCVSSQTGMHLEQNDRFSVHLLVCVVVIFPLCYSFAKLNIVLSQEHHCLKLSAKVRTLVCKGLNIATIWNRLRQLSVWRKFPLSHGGTRKRARCLQLTRSLAARQATAWCRVKDNSTSRYRSKTLHIQMYNSYLYTYMHIYNGR